MENKVTADYVDEEGCLHCGICGKRKQMKVSLMGFEHVVSCLCECEVKARQELDEKMQREEAQRLLYQRKSVGLRERRFWEWKFENDNGSNQKILIARQYVENWTDMKRKNVGLLLMGPVGTGKSFFAGCIANALLEQGERVMMTNFSRILNEMTSYQADKNQIIQNLVDYPLLIIDDLGIERNSEFALEQVYNVIDSRYCKMLPLIVTTNLGLNEMKSTDLDTAHQRIYSMVMWKYGKLVPYVPAEVEKTNMYICNEIENMRCFPYFDDESEYLCQKYGLSEGRWHMCISGENTLKVLERARYDYQVNKDKTLRNICRASKLDCFGTTGITKFVCSIAGMVSNEVIEKSLLLTSSNPSRLTGSVAAATVLTILEMGMERGSFLLSKSKINLEVMKKLLNIGTEIRVSIRDNIGSDEIEGEI